MSEMKKCTCPVHEKLESVVGAIHPPQEECACRKALENIVNVGENTHIRRHVRVASEALATPCPCAELRDEIAQHDDWRENAAYPEIAKLRAELATARAGLREAVEELRLFAAHKGSRTNASAIVARYDAAQGGGE